MRGIPTALLLLLSLGVLAACAQSRPAGEVYPFDAPTLPNLAPPVIPAARIAANPTITATSAVSASGVALSELAQVRVSGADGFVTCLPSGDFVLCHDSFLDLEYAYPAFMGRITGAEITPGDWGQAYALAIDGSWSDEIGGRSRDFLEARDPMFTDQGGFCSLSAEDMCRWWNADLCTTVKPGVFLMGVFPEAKPLCEDGRTFGVSPVLVVAVDLPQHPVIHGMGFAAHLLPPSVEEELADQWISERTGQTCLPESQADFDRQMAEMRQALEAGTAELDIQARYDAMLHLAESVAGPYVEDCSSLQAAQASSINKAVADADADLDVAFVCPVTSPNGSTPPGEQPSSLHHGNGELWTVLWPDGTVMILTDQAMPDGRLPMKFPWWRGVAGSLAISGRRLDAPAPPLEAEVPDDYGDSGFQASGLIFPSAGCWEVTGWVGDHELTFVTRVVQVAVPQD